VALRAAMRRLLEDAELRERLGAAARRQARERFSAEAAARAMISAYEAALA
jgi:glycosyltransferase involved in cell wall biosynthesis